jgi:phospholipid/cholesterol/gamma-HCH transport system ATP-binding protein
VLADGKVLVERAADGVEKYDHPWVQEYFHGPRGTRCPVGDRRNTDGNQGQHV